MYILCKYMLHCITVAGCARVLTRRGLVADEAFIIGFTSAFMSAIMDLIFSDEQS